MAISSPARGGELIEALSADLNERGTFEHGAEAVFLLKAQLAQWAFRLRFTCPAFECISLQFAREIFRS